MKKDFTSFGQFQTPPQANQSLVLKGSIKSTFVRSFERNSTQSCTYQSYCMACTTGIDANGQLSNDCGLKFNFACPCTEPIRKKVTEFSDDVRVHLLSVKTGEQLGELQVPPQARFTNETLAVTGSCN